MSVSFYQFGEHVASSRYRAIIPAEELAKLGVQRGNQWLVIGKHSWNWDVATQGFEKVCYDVCDDHFNDRLQNHYRECVDRADLVTCNSHEMRRVIKRETGRDATVIADPYEWPQRSPKFGHSLLWFGHALNLQDVAPYIQTMKPEIVTNDGYGFTTWTKDNMQCAFDRAGMVILPTGKSMAKSGNRAIEAIRQGLFVVHGYLPAYGDLGMYCGDIGDGVEWAKRNKDEVIERIRKAQNYIRDEYSPIKIAKQWKAALSL